MTNVLQERTRVRHKLASVAAGISGSREENEDELNRDNDENHSRVKSRQLRTLRVSIASRLTHYVKIISITTRSSLESSNA